MFLPGHLEHWVCPLGVLPQDWRTAVTVPRPCPSRAIFEATQERNGHCYKAFHVSLFTVDLNPQSFSKVARLTSLYISMTFQRIKFKCQRRMVWIYINYDLYFGSEFIIDTQIKILLARRRWQERLCRQLTGPAINSTNNWWSFSIYLPLMWSSLYWE